MQIVVDANVIIALLIKPGKPINLFFVEELEIFAPQLLISELEDNKEEITEKSNITNEDLRQLMAILKERIIFIPEEEFIHKRNLAEKICPDEKDIAYFALSLHLHCALWSNEKKLKEQNTLTVYATHELIKLFNL